MDKQLKNCNPKWAEKTGSKMIGQPPIRFIPKETEYDNDDSTNTFSLYLNISSSTPEVTVKKRKLESGEEVTEKEVSKEGQVRQSIKKLCTGDAKAYIKWHKQLDQVILGKPCDNTKSKFEIVEMMLYGDLKDTWQEISETIRKAEITKEKTDKDGKKVSTTAPRGYSSTAFRLALDKLKTQFFQKFAARKEKAYMRMGLQKPRDISIKQMSSRLRVMNSYLSRFPAPENVSFSTGELIEIVIGMIPHNFVTSMVNAGIEPREMGYNELIDHLVNLESTITTTYSEEHSSTKKDKDAKKGTFPKKGKDKDKGRTGSESKCCILCKAIKGESNPAWKTHNTNECKSKDYYAKKVNSKGSGNNNYDKDKKKNAYKRNKSYKQSMRREIKRALKRRDAGYSSSDSDESKSE